MGPLSSNIRFFSTSVLQLRAALSQFSFNQAAKKTSIPVLPVGFRKVSPFGCYVKENFVKSEGENASAVMSRLGEEWKGLSIENKKRYKEMSENSLKERAAKFAALSYEEQQKLREDSKKNFELRKERKERKLKRESRPPKPLTGYNIFMKERLAQQKKEGETQKDLLLKAVEEWKRLPESMKEKYNACAVEHSANKAHASSKEFRASADTGHS